MNGHNGKVVVITGASAGVGRATVREFARHGAKIGLLARGRDGLEAARREVEELGGRGLVLPTDTSNYEQVEAAAEQVERELGPIDIWVNDAMVSVFSPVSEMLPEDYRRVTEVTYLGYVHGTLAALKRMRPRNRGIIIQVGSALAYRGIPLQSAYCAAKHAIEGFCESLWCELLHENSDVRLTMVQLPGVNTPQFDWVKSRLPRKPKPVPPVYQPEVIARVIVWAADQDRREIYVGFPTVEAIVGNKISPRLLDHYLARTGFDSQQRPEPDDPNRPNNLWEPLPGDHGARGAFDAEARDSSPQVWLTEHRGKLLLAGAGALAAVLGGLWAQSANRRNGGVPKRLESIARFGQQALRRASAATRPEAARLLSRVASALFG